MTMTITSAFANALSGLTASSRQAAVTSNNIANALVPGYARRSVEATPGPLGGVQILGITRHRDQAMVTERRDVGADHANADTLNTYRTRVEDIIGTPEDGTSLSGLYARFESALVDAASRPDLPERQAALLTAATNVTQGLNDKQDQIQRLREHADAEISATVLRTNDLLVQIHDLNEAVGRARNSHSETASLIDMRQQAIDELSGIVPVRTAPRDGGALAVYTPGGTILLDGKPGSFDFDRSNTITPYQTFAAGTLSGLTFRGESIDVSPNGPLAGSRLSALFQVRDEFSVQAQSRLDSAARDLIERFQDPALDATRAPGDPGLFTDNGSAFATADEVGIAGRIAVNAAVDPARGGATWRLRDGLSAAAPGAIGNASLLHDMQAAMTARRTPSNSDLGTSGLSAAAFASSVESLAGIERQASEDRLAFAAVRQSEMEERYLADGVDTDEEMQNLLQIEQNYAANARMIQVLDEMMDLLLRI